jgi:hypothetical protein
VHQIARYSAAPEPETSIRLEEQIDLVRRQSQALELELRERLDPIAGKSNTEVFIGEQSLDDDSNHVL